MRRAGRAVVALALAAAMPSVGRAASAQKPYEAIRSLQKLQDGIAVGDGVAETAHVKMLGSIARLFAKADAATWNDPRNARALVIYLFSGGRAGLIAQAIPESAVAPDTRALFAGALAYGLGDDTKARAQLMPIDAKALPSGLGGRLALVQAILCTDDEKAKAIELLDLARLLEPGTLVEEAALRKELSLIGANGDLDKFGMLARRYAGAFAHSTYADNYRQLLVSLAMQIGTADTREASLRLSRVTASLGAGERRKLFLTIAREAVLSGHTTIAALAAADAASLSQKESSEAARAKVYLGAATIFGDGFERGRQALDTAAPGRLDARDQALRLSAIAIADMIRKEPVVTDEHAEAAHSAVLADGERSIAHAEASLKSADP